MTPAPICKYLDESMEPPSSKETPPEKSKKPQHVTIAAKPQPATQSSIRIHGFSDIARKNRANEEDGQAYYAGGSERSGQQIIGPSRKANSKENFVVEMFKAAKKNGAQVIEPGVDDGARKSPSAGGSLFSGSGYKLGDATTGSESGASLAPPVDSAQQQPSVSRVIKMWEDGFSIDDGPLLSYDSASTQQFLQAMRQGEIPAELLQEADGAELSLIMEDHRHEQFVVPQRAKVMAFEGTGHRLGAVTPTLSRRSSATIPPLEHLEANAKKAIKLNESLPTTNVQIRLSDGSRLVAHMNQTNTVADIRKYIVIARPEYEAATFALMTTFPCKELTDEKATLKEANLLNVVIVQRLT
nr:NSFL1 cofactor p47-like [Dermacentor andersoni]